MEVELNALTSIGSQLTAEHTGRLKLVANLASIWSCRMNGIYHVNFEHPISCNHGSKSLDVVPADHLSKQPYFKDS
jgi:hypothetical protein